MTTLVTIAGDALDALVAEHYGATAASAGLAAVLAANRGLAAQGPILPAGLVLRFPDPPLPELPRTRAWD